MTRLVVGLGNPGPDHEGSRHNVGFRVVEHLARHEGLLFHTASRLEGYTGPRNFLWARSHEPDAWLVLPQTFMNLSGQAVGPLARFAGVPAERILVVYDDLDLPLGALRIRPHGGAGGHNGMRSIIDTLETDRFPRLRVGIGRGGTDAARYVLARFSPDQEEEIGVSVAEASEAISFWLRSGDLAECMTRFHSRWSQDAD